MGGLLILTHFYFPFRCEIVEWRLFVIRKVLPVEENITGRKGNHEPGDIPTGHRSAAMGIVFHGKGSYRFQREPSTGGMG